MPAPAPTPAPEPAPAPAPAPTVETTPAAAVKLTASAKTVYIGQTATFIATVDPAAATALRIEVRRAGTSTWSTAAELVTDNTGRVIWACDPQVTSEYRAVTADGRSVSGVVKVNVRARATVKSSAKIVHKSGSVTMSGSIVTATDDGVSASAVSAASVRVVLQRKHGSRWVNVRTLKTSATGRFNTRVKMTSRGEVRYRVVVLDSEAYLGTASNVVVVRVK